MFHKAHTTHARTHSSTNLSCSGAAPVVPLSLSNALLLHSIITTTLCRPPPPPLPIMLAPLSYKHRACPVSNRHLAHSHIYCFIFCLLCLSILFSISLLCLLCVYSDLPLLVCFCACFSDTTLLKRHSYTDTVFSVAVSLPHSNSNEIIVTNIRIFLCSLSNASPLPIHSPFSAVSLSSQYIAASPNSSLIFTSIRLLY